MKWSVIITQVLFQAGALGYGLTREIEKTRAPALVIIARILQKYRKKSSYLFMVHYGLFKAPPESGMEALPEDLILNFGFIHRDIRQLMGLYTGLRIELNHARATSACAEIVRSLHLNGKSRKIKKRTKK